MMRQLMRKLRSHRLFAVASLLLAAPLLHSCSESTVDDAAVESAGADKPIEVKVVVVAMFERGDIRGDVPGDLQLWLERLHLDTRIEFPLGEEALFMNDDGILAVLTGGGISNATASIMALGLDTRFDLSNSYWLVAGIAGGDPEDISLGSAAWALHVVDGDLAYEIDGREIPDDWPYGMIPLDAKKPTTDAGDLNPARRPSTISFDLNPELTAWAFSLTRDLDLGDSEGIASYRAAYNGHPEAQRPPFVMIGDNLSASTYWHGALLNDWANDWVPLYAGGDASFVTSAMEDSGTLTAMQRLAVLNRIDMQRVMVLRTVSNYTMPPKGESAVWSKAQPYPDNGIPSFESAFVVGNTVVQALVENWDTYKEQIPANR